ncbi:MAG TPA: hypothetical protein VMY69_02880 [Phycisphaerae bacterium]|nr:hypothetical protein [Phycisphaerae bacterium]
MLKRHWRWAAVLGLAVLALVTAQVYAAMTAKTMGRYGGWAYYSAEVDLPAGARTEIVAAVAGKRIRVVALMINANVAGTVTLESATTAISGDINLAATGGFVLPPVPEESARFYGWMDTAAGEALNATTVTCTIDGVLVFAVEQ